MHYSLEPRKKAFKSQIYKNWQNSKVIKHMYDSAVHVIPLLMPPGTLDYNPYKKKTI